MKISRISFANVAFCIFSLVVIIMQILPRIVHTLHYNDIFLAFLPFLLIFYFTDFSLLKKISLILSFIVLMTLFRLVFNAWGDFITAANMGYQLFLMCIPFFIFIAMVKRNSTVEKHIIVLVAAAIFLIVAINTFKELAVNPSVARILASGVRDDKELILLRNSNIGGYGFSYSIGMLVPYVSMLICRVKGTKKWWFVALLAVLFVYVFNAQYATLVLFSVISTFIVFIIYAKKTVTKVVLIFAGVILVLNLSNIILFLSNISNLNALSHRLKDLYNGLQGQGLNNSRPDLILKNLKLFIQNPLFGVDIKDSANLTIINSSHTLFFGLLASGGIFGVLFYYGVLLNMVKQIKAIVPSFKEIWPVYFWLLVLSFVNPITNFELFTMAFLIIPGIELLFNKARYNKLENCEGKDED